MYNNSIVVANSRCEGCEKGEHVGWSSRARFQFFRWAGHSPAVFDQAGGFPWPGNFSRKFSESTPCNKRTKNARMSEWLNFLCLLHFGTVELLYGAWEVIVYSCMYALICCGDFKAASSRSMLCSNALKAMYRQSYTTVQTQRLVLKLVLKHILSLSNEDKSARKLVRDWSRNILPGSWSYMWDRPFSDRCVVSHIWDFRFR